MTNPNDSARPAAPSTPASDPHAEQQVTLCSPAELADALPYLMGFQPDDSLVMVALHGERGRFGGRLRLGIPSAREEWPDVCAQLAETLVTGSNKRGARPDGVVLFLCQDPGTGESAQEVMERLRPLAQSLRVACGTLDMPVYEALCISDGRFWSYCCPDTRCCPPEGTPMALPGTSVMAAAATYAGIEVRGSLRQMEARYAPLTGDRADEQERALDAASVALVPRILRAGDCEGVRQETLDLARRMVRRFDETPPVPGRAESDARDDGLIAPEEAATVVIGLQDRTTRDRAAEWMEGPQAPAVLRVWRALARRCVPPYTEHAAAPITLAGWVAWSVGDQPEARVALSRALGLDPQYLFAQLLHRACNEGLDPEPLRHCLRREQADRALRAAVRAEAARAEAVDAEAAEAEAADPETADAETIEAAGMAPTSAARRRTRPGGSAATTGPRGTTGPADRPRVRRRSAARELRNRQDRPQ
ncbi:DUF4192 domain-containing protein [Streptomyces sp. ISL-11]|uniref:DUF4192 domain-containing protein n=1 Tax=Streptomyces sp. ISL-11 TaxID=2819174 RepID=UPI001BE7F752|nr:DUF4192 domain-containing protein [Streptomyces sp. ISL-11]MBT2387754.1 DUF4192 domain-containing protein [Streptomyces sp. ISL-11]